ncbi:MAG: Ribosomal large subunit pseudouridine synthase A [Syntrophomonadaceae bacterium]|nr:Ribosomal large subunit pseudouridine synthase A [Bacillota bacterium]
MNSKIRLIFEDNHLLVAEKPVNLLSQPDRTGDPDVLSLLKEDIKRRHHKPGNVYLGLVQRLDRPAGGLMVFARTSKAAARLSAQLRDRTFLKTYLAVVRGCPSPPERRLRHFLAKDSADNRVFCAVAGKEAELDYRLVECRQDLSLVSIRLHTGRSHQIRVQMSLAGYPLYGDQKYGSKVNKPGEQLALWAAGVTFAHPVRDEPLTFKSTPPAIYPWCLFNLLGGEQ